MKTLLACIMSMSISSIAVDSLAQSSNQTKVNTQKTYELQPKISTTSTTTQATYARPALAIPPIPVQPSASIQSPQNPTPTGVPIEAKPNRQISTGGSPLPSASQTSSQTNEVKKPHKTRGLGSLIGKAVKAAGPKIVKFTKPVVKSTWNKAIKPAAKSIWNKGAKPVFHTGKKFVTKTAPRAIKKVWNKKWVYAKQGVKEVGKAIVVDQAVDVAKSGYKKGKKAVHDILH